MQSPYSPPKSKTIDSTSEIKRVTHSFVVFFSGILLVPSLVLGAFVLLLPSETISFGSFRFWSTILATSSIAAMLALPFKRMPLWVAVILGFLAGLFALMAIVGWMVFSSAA